MNQIFAIMRHFLFFIVKGLFTSQLLLLFFIAAAQKEVSVRFSDSVDAGAYSRYISNNITLTNTLHHSAELLLYFEAPAGWQSLSTQEKIILHEGEKRIIPLTIIPSQNALAHWLPFVIKSKNLKTQEQTSYTFYIKAAAVRRFSSRMLTPDAMLLENPKNFSLSIYLKNTGNVKNTYNLKISNGFFEIREQKKIVLNAGADTIYNASFKVSADNWINLKKEKINVEVFDTLISMRNYNLYVSRLSNNYKQHTSAYATFPLELGFGYLNFDKQTSYFGFVRGSVPLAKNKNINFYYRTKEIGLVNQLQRNIFSIGYSTKKLNLNIGSINYATYFLADGYGINGTYSWKKNAGISLASSFHSGSSYYKNENVEATLKLPIGKIRMENAVAGNFESETKVNSYLLMNKIFFANKDVFKFDIKFGGGKNDYLIPTRQLLPEKFGMAAGYNFFYQKKKYLFTSIVDYYSKYFPGLYSGYFTQNHEMRYAGKKGGVGLFYQLNKIESNYFTDTVFNSTAFTYNISRYGVNADVFNKDMSARLSLGILDQVGSSGNNLSKYYFSDWTYSFTKGKKFRFNLSLFNGVGRLNRNDKQSQWLWLNNSSASVSYSNIGVYAFFVSNPVIREDTVKRIFEQYSRTYNINPFIGHLFFKKLFVNISYNYSKSLYDSSNSSFLNSRVNYTNEKKGINISLFASNPIKKSNAPVLGRSSSYINLSVSKKFNVPIFTQKKFYNLKLIAFNDLNNNGIRDENEPGLKNVQINVNKEMFVTGKEGDALYQNIDKGIYTIDLKNVTGLKGLVPAFGDVQPVVIEKSTTYAIPFKKSRIITGKVFIRLDPHSNTTFTPDGIKITVSDSTGKMWNVITDKEGEFYVNLPANIYTVSLNPDAFNEQLKPEIMAYSVNLIKNEDEIVKFTVIEKNRKIRMLKTGN